VEGGWRVLVYKQAEQWLIVLWRKLKEEQDKTSSALAHKLVIKQMEFFTRKSPLKSPVTVSSF